MDDINHLRTELKMLGNQHKKWREKIPLLQDRVRRAHAAGMTQTEIVTLSGYERDNVRLLCMDPQQREAMRARRRKLTAEAEGNGQLLDANEKSIEQMERTAADTGARVKRGRPKRK